MCIIWLGLRTNLILRESVGNILVVEKVGTTKAKKEQVLLEIVFDLRQDVTFFSSVLE